MAGPKIAGLLIRMPVGGAGVTAGAKRFSLAGSSVELEPLFTVPGGGGGLGLASDEKQWFRARTGAIEGSDAWQAAHDAARSLSLDGAHADFVEPDFEEPWPERERKLGVSDGSRLR